MEMIEVEAFVTIAQLGGFTRAATALHCSQPAISRRIELLEHELGAPLFERLHSGVRLTDAGEAFLPYAQHVLAAVRDGAEAVRETRDEDRGWITLALVGTLASTRLAAHLQRFRIEHPQIRLILHTARSDEVSALVRRGDAHLGLRYFTDPQPDIVSLDVAEEALVVVCAAQSGLADTPSRTAASLIGVPWVAFPTGSDSSGDPYTRILERQLLACGLEGAEIIAIDSLTAQKRLIEAGFGIGLLPASSIEEEVRLGTLQILDIAALRTTVPVTIIHRRRAFLSRAVRRLLEDLTGSP